MNATLTRHDVMAEVLGRVNSLGFEMGAHGFSSHAPMGVEALVALGHPDLAESWIDGYIRDVPHFSRPEVESRIDANDEHQWRNALGEERRLEDWSLLFRREIVEAPWREVLARWWLRLVPGFQGSLTHGLIRTAHAVRTLAGDPAPTTQALNELADALGYLAAQYSPLPYPPRPTGSLTVREAIAGLPPIQPRDAIGAGVASRRGGKTGDTASLAGFEDAVNALTAPADYDAALLALTRETAIALRNKAAQKPAPVSMIAAIHMVDAPAAARMLLPHLPADSLQETYGRVWQVTAALTSSFGGGLAIPEADADREPLGLDELDARAVENGGAHAIKFTEACFREYQATGHTGYLFAAEDVVPLAIATETSPGG